MRTEVDRPVQDLAVGGRLQREAVIVAFVENRDPDVAQGEFRRVMLAHRASAARRRAPRSPAGASSHVDRVSLPLCRVGTGTPATEIDAVAAARHQHVRLIDDQAGKRGMKLPERLPRKRGGGVRNGQRRFAFRVADDRYR